MSTTNSSQVVYDDNTDHFATTLFFITLILYIVQLIAIYQRKLWQKSIFYSIYTTNAVFDIIHILGHLILFVLPVYAVHYTGTIPQIFVDSKLFALLQISLLSCCRGAHANFSVLLIANRATAIAMPFRHDLSFQKTRYFTIKCYRHYGDNMVK